MTSFTSGRLQTSHVRLNQILCPVDLSPASKQALTHARALAAWHHASLTVLEVMWVALPPTADPAGTMNGFTMARLGPEERERLQTELQEFSRPGPGEPEVPTNVRVADGPPARGIVDAANDLPADLIVLGTHGLSGFDRLILGSVTDKVLRKARCPVLTIPPHIPRLATSGPYETIVCAIDFSPASLAGLQYALSLAELAAARLLLVHVLDWSPERLAPEPGSKAEVHDRAMRASLAASLAETIPAGAVRRATTEQVVEIGRAHEEIVRMAESRKADLIVIGVHGRSALDVAFFGSTTNQVIRHATCPVLTVRR